MLFIALHCLLQAIIINPWFIHNNITEIEQVIPLDWWGHKLGYIGGGFLGAETRRRKSLQAEKPNERTMFNEDDQENLYNLVQV